MRNILLVAAQRSRVAGSLGVVALLGVAACSGQVSDPNGTNPPSGVTNPSGTTGAGGTTVPVQMPTGPCSTSASLGPSRIWSLTDAEYVSSVASLFGVRLPNEVTVPDTQPADYTNLSEVTTVDSRATEAYQTAAEKAAFAAVTANLDVFMPCGTSDACVTTFIKSRIARAFRRPVTDTEVQDLVALYHTGLADSPATGVRLVIEAALQSPSFIYRTELGPAAGATGKVSLTPYEVATALSFAVLDSIPDDQLWQKAEDGSLVKPAVLKGEVDRLLALPEVQANLSQKAGFWLGVERLHSTEKDNTIFPEYTADLKQDLYDSARMFVQDIFSKGTVTDLLSSSRLYVNANLAKVYGLPSAGLGAALVASTSTLPERSLGILTQPAVLAAYSRPNRGDPIHRGLFVYNSLICGATIPSPPGNALAVAATFPSSDTERQLAGLRASDSHGCGACHGLFDPLGLSTEKYDPIGRYQTMDASGPIDSSSTLSAQLGPDLAGPVTGLPDLVAKLEGAGRRVPDCAATNLGQFVLGRSMIGDNSCAFQNVKDQFAMSGGSFLDYYRAILTSPGFLTRDVQK
jgi:hypothetical protein